MTLSAGSVSIGVTPDTKGFGSLLHRDIMGMSSVFSGIGRQSGGPLPLPAGISPDSQVNSLKKVLK